MGTNGGEKLEAAQEAANFYVDVTRDDDGLAVVPYNEDVDPAPFELVVVTGTVRADAETYIDDLTDGGWTSIGDGLLEAVDQRGSSPTGNPRCSFVLLSDGMENADARWSDVITDVVDTGCPVTAIAFGPESDETLMQDIATETGGAFFYNDVYVSTAVSAMAPGALTPAQMALALDDVYEYAEALGEGRQRLLQEGGAVSANNPTAVHEVYVDNTVAEAVFALDWFSKAYARLNLRLVTPDGTVIRHTDKAYTFEDEANGHVGWRWVKPQPELWTLIVDYVGSEIGLVDYQVLVSAHSKVTLHLLLPDRLGSRYYTGNRVPIYAFFSASEPITGAEVKAWVTAPDGTTTLVWLLDDGEHGDGGRDDGLYAGLYTLVNQAEQVYPEGEKDQATPNDEGAYRVRVRARRGDIQREALGGFAVQESPDDNGNRMPDAYEEEYGISNPTDDPDGDSLNNTQEYHHGTNPHDSDTDDGGENDGSEVSWRRDPLNPTDDALEGPDYLEVLPWYEGIVRLRYDVSPTYAAMYFRRISPVVATQSAGPVGPPGEVMGELAMTGAYTDTTTVSGGMSVSYTHLTLPTN